MPRAGYDLGRELGGQKFVGKPAKIIAKTGDIIGCVTAGIGVMLGAGDYLLGDGERVWMFLLIGGAGVLFLAAMHGIAGKLDGKRKDGGK